MAYEIKMAPIGSNRIPSKFMMYKILLKSALLFLTTTTTSDSLTNSLPRKLERGSLMKGRRKNEPNILALMIVSMSLDSITSSYSVSRLSNL